MLFSIFVPYFQFYQELVFIQQTEMAAPSQGSYLTPAGHIMPAYSGRGRPPLNPQQQHGAIVNVSFQSCRDFLREIYKNSNKLWVKYRISF